MASGDKFWVDGDLFEIPLLTCDHENLDYTAIMSRFHYLLLRKDKETHKEFVKYWAILIITAPDAFAYDKAEHNKNLVFSKVQDSAIKLNRPTENIELPPGQPKLEPADDFRYENWKPFLDETYSRTDMDDLAVYRWYTDPANTMAARSFFGVYCMLLFRAYNREPSATVAALGKTVLHHGFYEGDRLQKPLPVYAPDSRISFSLSTATYLRDAFRSQIGTYRKVLRIVLDWYEYHTDYDEDCVSKRRWFFEQYVRRNLIYYGLSIMIFAASYLVNIEPWLKLKSAYEKTGSKKFLLAMDSFDTFRENIDGIRLQDRTFLKQKPQFRGENCRFWPYSRLFSSLYFKSVGDENNLEFLAFCLGYRNLNRDSYNYNYNCFLANSIYDNNIKEVKYMIQMKTKEEIERGWNEGKAIFTSQISPK